MPRVTERFATRGVKVVFNVEGGMDAWAREIDPGVPRYWANAKDVRWASAHLCRTPAVG